MDAKRCMRIGRRAMVLAWWLAAAGAVPAAAVPRMPGSYEVSHSQGGNLSWRETGTLPMSYPNGMRTVKGTLEQQGYALQYEIPLATGMDGPPKTLMQWDNGTERILVLLWEQDGQTGLSWGVSE